MLHAEHLWTPLGWQRDARIESSDGVETRARFVLPGMPNLHSHAFQRAMAGLAERRGPADGFNAPVPEREDQKPAIHGLSVRETFWSWRETMYAFASRVGPEALRAIAAQLYVEMLKAGYTRVCEFHYLHNAPDGKPYADPAAMSLALIEAAREAGIGLTLLPVLYMTGGFDGRPLSERQRRFGLTVDAYLRLVESLRAMESPRLRIGIALHSLRAVPEPAMREVLGANAPTLARERGRETGAQSEGNGRNPAGPIHIHIAEQVGEVQDCVALRNARPVQWLFANADVDARWCLVHATHLDDGEVGLIARSGAVAGLCPTTEANLGDGLFPLPAYLDAGGVLGIGSDSQVSVSPVEELRWLEYGQRLATRHRNVAARGAGESVGESLWRAALQGGRRAAGTTDGQTDGDLLVLDDASALLAGRDNASVIDTFLFAGNTPLVRDVLAGGKWVVRDFRHRDEARIAARYRATVEALVNA